MVFFVKKERVEIIFAGLGNPGVEYEATKHNVGFRALDAFAAEHFPNQKFNKHIGSQVIKGEFSQHSVLIAKPQQFMNMSGKSLKWLSKKYPPEEIVVIYDDMDLPPGRIRLAQTGGSAGHHGMGSIMDYMKSEEIKRIRIGIGGRGDMEGGEYVLTPFTGLDAQRIENAIAIAVKAMEHIITDGFERSMNLFNRRDIDEILLGETRDEQLKGIGED